MERDYFYLSAKMSHFRNSHRILVEESRYSTIFEASLHSKMSTINLNNDVVDNSRTKRQFFYMKKVVQIILIKELMKLRKIANLHHSFSFEIESFITNRFWSDP